MISSCFDKKTNAVIPTMAFPTLTSVGPADIISIRDALADVLKSVVSNEETKADVRSDSMFVLSEMVNTLTKDLEGIFEAKGGSQC
jgi:hypothetical protein